MHKYISVLKLCCLSIKTGKKTSKLTQMNYRELDHKFTSKLSL